MAVPTGIARLRLHVPSTILQCVCVCKCACVSICVCVQVYVKCAYVCICECLAVMAVVVLHLCYLQAGGNEAFYML